MIPFCVPFFGAMTGVALLKAPPGSLLGTIVFRVCGWI
jgi:hypothetical protein